MLMAASHERILPALLSSSDGKELRCDQKLYNDLIGMYKNCSGEIGEGHDIVCR